MRGTILERFLDKVEILGHSPGGCWVWLAHRDKDGYGTFSVSHGETKQAHRVAYELFVGKVPADLVVCHRCNHTYCVNPDHLRIDTISGNVRQAFDQGLIDQKGSNHNGSKLADSKVAAIRTSKDPQWLLAHRYKVSQQTISDIKRGKSWRHLEFHNTQ